MLTLYNIKKETLCVEVKNVYRYICTCVCIYAFIYVTYMIYVYHIYMIYMYHILNSGKEFLALF